MKRSVFKTSLTAVTFSATTVLSFISHAGLFNHEEEVQWNDVPPVVKKTITAHADDGNVDKVEKAVKDNRIVYKVIVNTPMYQRIKLEVADDGKLAELRYKGKDEKEIDWNQVPIRVQRAFIRYAQDAKMREDEVKIDSRDGITIYEGIADTPGRGTIEMKISPDGKLLELKIDEY